VIFTAVHQITATLISTAIHKQIEFAAN